MKLVSNDIESRILSRLTLWSSVPENKPSSALLWVRAMLIAPKIPVLQLVRNSFVNSGAKLQDSQSGHEDRAGVDDHVHLSYNHSHHSNVLEALALMVD